MQPSPLTTRRRIECQHIRIGYATRACCKCVRTAQVQRKPKARGHAIATASRGESFVISESFPSPSLNDGEVARRAGGVMGRSLKLMTPPSAARTPPLASEGRKAKMVTARERALLRVVSNCLADGHAA